MQRGIKEAKDRGQSEAVYVVMFGSAKVVYRCHYGSFRTGIIVVEMVRMILGIIRGNSIEPTVGMGIMDPESNGQRTIRTHCRHETIQQGAFIVQMSAQKALDGLGFCRLGKLFVFPGLIRCRLELYQGLAMFAKST